jgi:hypothetical protein
MLSGYPAWVCKQDAAFGHSRILNLKGFQSSESTPRFEGGFGQDLANVRPFRHQTASLGCGFWLDRSVFLEVGGITENLRINEDTDFSIKLIKSTHKGVKAPPSRRDGAPPWWSQ